MASDFGSLPPDAPDLPVTMRVSGPFEGAVTVTPIDGGHGRTLVKASWTETGQARTDSVETETYEDARIIAREAADDLAAGRAPSLERD